MFSLCTPTTYRSGLSDPVIEIHACLILRLSPRKVVLPIHRSGQGIYPCSSQGEISTRRMICGFLVLYISMLQPKYLSTTQDPLEARESCRFSTSTQILTQQLLPGCRKTTTSQSTTNPSLEQWRIQPQESSMSVLRRRESRPTTRIRRTSATE